jgi:hypothetical protein
MTTIQAYRYHADQPRWDGIEVRVDGVVLDVLAAATAAIATCALDGPCRVEVRRTGGQIAGASVHPVSLGIAVEQAGPDGLAFVLPGPRRLLILLPGGQELFLFADPLAEEPPTGRRVLRFAAGGIHEVGTMSLEDGDTLWIEGGAVLRGRLQVSNASQVTVCGRGVFDGGDYVARGERMRFLVFDRCRHVVVRDVMLINSPQWQLVFGACDDVAVSGIKEVGHLISTDGIDIVGCRRVRISACFHRCADDALVVKAVDLRAHPQAAPFTWARDVEDVEVSDCAIITHGGAAFEIGHELSTASVRGIRFHDCDVIATHHFGITFSIRNADRAVVEDVSYERIRVEHAYYRFIDMRVMRSMWSQDAERGHIRNVRFRDIDWHRSIFNAGYTTSELGGCDAGHLVEDVSFSGLRLDGVPVQSLDEIELHTRHCRNIRLEP